MTQEDVMKDCSFILSAKIKDPQFTGQICPVNWGSFIFADKIKEQSFITSSWVNLIPFGIKFLSEQNSLMDSVIPDLSPASWVPPSKVGIKLT